MKSLLLATILSITLLAPALARADASEQGCKSSDGKAKGCEQKTWGGWKNWDDKDKKVKNDPTSMPEPGIGVLVGSGLLALGGIAVLRRKQQPN